MHGQEKTAESIILHEPLTSFKTGESLEIRAKTSMDVEGLRIYYRYPNIKQFQARNLERQEGNSYFFKLETSEIPGLGFEYYLAAQKNGQTFFAPAEAPRELYQAKATSVGPLPEMGAELPTGETMAEKQKFKLPAEIGGSIQAVLRDPEAPPEAEKIKSNGNIRVFTKYQKNNFNLNVDSNFALASTPLADQKRLDLSNLSLSLNAGPHTLSAGDLNLNESEYSVYGFGRRGMDYLFNNQKAYIHLFDANSQEIKGFQGFGLPNRKANILGGALGYKFFGEAFSLKAIYLAGKDDPQLGRNVGFSSNYAPRKGNVLALTEETKLFQNKLTVTGEFARSSYDGDTRDGVQSKTDNALRLGGILSLGKFSIGANYRHIGKDFNPIGYQFFTNDRKNYDANIGLNIGKFNIRGAYTVSRDNVENNPSSATTTNRNFNGALDWLASEKLTFNFSYKQDRQKTEMNQEANASLQDSVAHQLSGALNLNLSRAAMITFSLTDAQISSQNNPQTNNLNLTANLGGTFRAGDFFSIMPTLSYSEMRNKFSGVTTSSWNSFFTAELNFIPQVLATSLSGSYMKTGGDPQNTSNTLTLSWNLNVSSQKLIKLGNIILSLRGNYNRTSSAATSKSYLSLFLQTDFTF